MSKASSCVGKMSGERNLTCNAVGLCLLPSELLQDIFLRLASPEILRLRSVSKTLSSVVSGDDFRHLYGRRSSSETWLFLYKKRSPREAALYGFNDRSGRWFRFPVAGILLPVVPPGEDLYFLAASGDFFLFSSNNRRELIAVKLTSNTVKKIPASPLGPRGTSSWRRSGLKLIAGPPGSDSFRFVFAEMYENRPVLFVYSSITDTWQSLEASESGRAPRVSDGGTLFLSVVHRRRESLLICAGAGQEAPVVMRPRFEAGVFEERLAVGLIAGNASDRLHVYGDGRMAVVRSGGFDGEKVFGCVELWGLSSDGRGWELISRVPKGLVERERIRKRFGAMTGCLEERDGVIRVVLMSNYKGLWDLIWLAYDLERREWSWVPLPDNGTSGLNMAGIAVSSALRLRSSGS